MPQNAAKIHAGSAAKKHGGNLAAARAAFPDAPEPWIDLSTGISPWPYPLPALPDDCWTRLPAAEAEAGLRQAAARYFGVDDANAVLAAPGAQALIQVLPRLRPRSRVAVVSPTYAEHEAAWRAAGHDVTERSTLADAMAGGADVVVIVNPNNPDGRSLAAPALLDATAALTARGGWLVVDEAFADAAAHNSVAPHAGAAGLVILRSFGKFFGLAGLRLGFLLAPSAVRDAAAALLGPWAVSGPALAVGAAAYGDGAWIAATRRRLAAAAGQLDDALHAAGLTVVGGTPLFRLVEHADAAALFTRLAQAGIWTRPFAARPDWLRLGLPPDAAALARLAAALR